ncbi:N-acetyltransferase [Atribacter laminatus]|nr:N-acetyltransferase [Atribacter laminatus]
MLGITDMGWEIREAQNQGDIKKFVTFPLRLYRNHPYYVPPLISDEMGIFSPAKNPAYENCETKLFLIYHNNSCVGRIAGIISHIANEKYQEKNLRFGWFDSINEEKSAELLFSAIESWGKERGMTTCSGPQGFTDLDPTGMLIDGFEELGTMATQYNYPYYPDLVENCGYSKLIDALEFQTKVPDIKDIPESLIKSAEWVKKRYNYQVLKFKNKKEALKRGMDLINLIDESYADLYGTVPLTEKQKNYYLKKYLPYIQTDFIKVVADEEDNLIGFLITMPSLSQALQKARGRLFPFGFWYLLKALKTYQVLDFYLAGVKKEYRNKGVDILMVSEITKTAAKFGFSYSESNPELETNKKIQNEWKLFKPRQHKRRRIYFKNI